MILPVVLLLLIVSVPVLGGDLRRVADVRLRWMGLALVALVAQIAIINVFDHSLPKDLAGLLHVATYVPAILMVLANLRVPGVALMALGGGMNLAAIAANGGVMPASPSALASAGLPMATVEFSNSTAVESARLAFLGDIWAIPEGWPLSNVFSLGDVLLVIGAAVFLHRICQSTRLPATLRGAGGVLSIVPFRRLWMAFAVSTLGDMSYALAVAVAVVEQEGGPRLLAVVFMAQAIAGVVGGLLGTTLVDRFDRRTMMILSDGARAAAVLTLLLSAEPSALHFTAVAVVLGIGGSLFQPSMQASLPNLLPKNRLVDANALISFTFHLTVIGGPILGGLLASHIGLRSTFILNAATFVGSLLLLAAVRLPAFERGPHQRTLEMIRDGFSYVRSTRIVRAVLLVTGFALFATAIRAPMMPVFVLDVLHGDAGILGVVAGTWGAGMLLGSLAVPMLTARWRAVPLLAASVGSVGLALAVTAFQTSVAPVLAAAIVAGAGNSIAVVLYESMLQAQTPDQVRGRVLAACEVVDGLGYVLGAGFVALAGTALGPRSIFLLAGAIFLTASLHVLRSLRTVELEPLDATPAAEAAPEPGAVPGTV